MLFPKDIWCFDDGNHVTPKPPLKFLKGLLEPLKKMHKPQKAPKTSFRGHFCITKRTIKGLCKKQQHILLEDHLNLLENYSTIPEIYLL